MAVAGVAQAVVGQLGQLAVRVKFKGPRVSVPSVIPPTPDASTPCPTSVGADLARVSVFKQEVALNAQAGNLLPAQAGLDSGRSSTAMQKLVTTTWPS